MNKSQLLTLIKDSLENGIVTRSDLQTIMEGAPAREGGSAPVASPGRSSAVDIMFYVAGVVLFAAIAALIGQSWDSGFSSRVLLSAGTGILFWATALILLRSSATSDIRRGITNLSLLTGSLLLISGGFITANELANFEDASFFAVSATLALLGLFHITFGWQIRRSGVVLAGVLLVVAAFPALTFWLLDGSNVPMYVNCLILAVSGGLLAYSTRVISKVGAIPASAARSFDPLATFGAMMSVYAASYDDDTSAIWLLLLILGIIGMFYLSIVRQDRIMLGNGSLFLVLAIITISFRYFDGYGVSGSLLIGALGLIATAVVATTINRRYIIN